MAQEYSGLCANPAWRLRPDACLRSVTRAQLAQTVHSLRVMIPLVLLEGQDRLTWELGALRAVAQPLSRLAADPDPASRRPDSAVVGMTPVTRLRLLGTGATVKSARGKFHMVLRFRRRREAVKRAAGNHGHGAACGAVVGRRRRKKGYSPPATVRRPSPDDLDLP